LYLDFAIYESFYGGMSGNAAIQDTLNRMKSDVDDEFALLFPDQAERALELAREFLKDNSACCIDWNS